jgi:hypothetical protein
MSSTTWDLAAIKTKVVQSVQGGCGVQLNDGNVSVAPDTGPVSGADITVTVTMPFSFLMVPITINNLSGQTIMRFETG